MTLRSAEIGKYKAACNDRGHEMGNAVNVAPFLTGAAWTVMSTCRRCRMRIRITWAGGMAWCNGSALVTPCRMEDG